MDRAIKTLIVDDEPVARQVLREELSLLPAIDLIGEASDGPEALRQIVDLQPDLVFLDLQMPQFDGFEVVRRLSGTRMPVVVIVTAFQERAIEAFEAGAVDYLLKPVRAERLQKAVERAAGLLGKPREIARDLANIASASPGQRKLVGRIGRDYFLLNLDEILALQAEGELVWIVTEKRRYLASQSLRIMENSLPAPLFQRVHRGAIVNTDHVRQMTALTSHRWTLTLSNRQEFVVSKRQAHNIRRLLHR
ncbi:MAG TPA: LytTR family DNA-binding domain-containing protein [Bryobacteraceae bacterium]|nr:LytTR family DNA-binding domain-containing protein [Bryobacteraceae bacterium]